MTRKEASLVFNQFKALCDSGAIKGGTQDGKNVRRVIKYESPSGINCFMTEVNGVITLEAL